jgi:hypothetical protein
VGKRGLGGAAAIGKRRGGAAMRGSADWGEEKEARGVLFSDLGFYRGAKGRLRK